MPMSSLLPPPPLMACPGASVAEGRTYAYLGPDAAKANLQETVSRMMRISKRHTTGSRSIGQRRAVERCALPPEAVAAARWHCHCHCHCHCCSRPCRVIWHMRLPRGRQAVQGPHRDASLARNGLPHCPIFRTRSFLIQPISLPLPSLPFPPSASASAFATASASASASATTEFAEPTVRTLARYAVPPTCPLGLRLPCVPISLWFPSASCRVLRKRETPSSSRMHRVI
ncbi:hypothetical protein K431DRAFT_328084 [Polychaeton citri CBS 116435]|uniref:Uncharacterized protein n=1 Tax=Polychaeton citri CBS 116435 TaxID=1314669 RepID=A0A9P4UQS2_9PEZI|nr:hypothetical protein K431DRAFT_328084 [Polychaeton citri CBS 116435]